MKNGVRHVVHTVFPGLYECACLFCAPFSADLVQSKPEDSWSSYESSPLTCAHYGSYIPFLLLPFPSQNAWRGKLTFFMEKMQVGSGTSQR